MTHCSAQLVGALIAVFVSSLVLAANSLPQPAKQPTEVKIVSVPPAPPPQPTEVKVTSMPAPLPTEVKVVSAPVDQSAHDLVKVTWVLVAANVVLCIATFIGSWWLSRDTKRRDRAVMEREIHRLARKNLTVAIVLQGTALEIPALNKRIHQLSELVGVAGQSLMDVESTLQRRLKRLHEIVAASSDVLVHVVSFEEKSDRAATTLLHTVDMNEVELDSIRDQIDGDRARVEKEIDALSQRSTAMQAAELHRTMV